MEISNLIYFIGISMLITVTPGPDNMYVITQSIIKGKKAGIFTSLGLCTGLIVHTTAAALGVSVVLQRSVIAFNILKYAGAIYLFFLAWKAYKDRNESLPDNVIKNKSEASLYRQGIYMNVLNPKVGIFFLAFLPQFVNSKAGNISGQMILLGIVFILQAIIIFIALAIFAGTFSDKIISKPRISKYINYIKCSIFALIGIKLALTDR